VVDVFGRERDVADEVAGVIESHEDHGEAADEVDGGDAIGRLEVGILNGKLPLQGGFFWNCNAGAVGGKSRRDRPASGSVRSRRCSSIRASTGGEDAAMTAGLETGATVWSEIGATVWSEIGATVWSEIGATQNA
jgi:hypothetical protein